MYKVKLEEDSVVIYFNIEVGKFNQTVTYKADLENKKYSFFESGEEKLLEWDEVKCEIQKEFDQIITDIKTKITNNKNVIGSYRIHGDKLNEEKAKKHLNRNEKILEYLNNYNFDN